MGKQSRFDLRMGNEPWQGGASAGGWRGKGRGASLRITQLPQGAEGGFEMILAQRIRLNPTADEESYFRRAAGTARFAWNWALAEWNDRYDLGANPDAGEIKHYFNSFKYEAFSLAEEHSSGRSRPTFCRFRESLESLLEGRGGRPAPV